MSTTSRLAQTLLPVVPGILSLLCPSSSDPATIRVPADQPTIPAALAVATAGDEVVADCGQYDVQWTAIPSGVTVRGATGNPECVRIGNTGDRFTFKTVDATGVLLQGLTFTRIWNARALLATNSSVRVEDCRFEYCSLFQVPGLLDFQNSSAHVENCTFVDNNHASWAVSDLIHAGGPVEVINCSFKFPPGEIGAGYPYAAIVGCVGDGPHSIRSCQFDNAYGTCVAATGCDAVVEDSTIRAGGALYSIFDASVARARAGASLTLRRCVAYHPGWMWLDKPIELFESTGGSTLALESCTIVSPAAYWRIFRVEQATLRIEQSIVDMTMADTVFECTGGTLSIHCSEIRPDRGTVFAGSCVPDTAGVFKADPMFCNEDAEYLALDGASPCLPGRSPCGELVGAFGMGCGTVGLEPQSWGRIKALYR